jgi:hypothetical protein
MTRFAIAAALALAVTLPAVTAQAQSPRTFVSAAGSDSNPCSFAAPCRHFQAAVNATSLGGEVDALDPAGYGPITINQAITIEGQGWSYIAPPFSGDAIFINAVSGKVYIHGVSLNGVGITGTTTGIVFFSGGSLIVRDCVIRNFSADGITVQQNSSNPTLLFVSNTLISENNGNGIRIQPAGTGTTSGVISHVDIVHNGDVGLLDITTTQTINMTFSDSVSANNSLGLASTGGGTPVNMMVRNSTIANNAQGLAASFTGGSIRITRSTITGNGVAWTVDSFGGQVTSYADNNIEDNGSANNAPLQIGLK